MLRRTDEWKHSRAVPFHWALQTGNSGPLIRKFIVLVEIIWFTHHHIILECLNPVSDYKWMIPFTCNHHQVVTLLNGAEYLLFASVLTGSQQKRQVQGLMCNSTLQMLCPVVCHQIAFGLLLCDSTVMANVFSWSPVSLYCLLSATYPSVHCWKKKAI